jgi:ribosome-associated translation inhibitor RaiA
MHAIRNTSNDIEKQIRRTKRRWKKYGILG